jgi:hypothetical protein
MPPCFGMLEREGAREAPQRAVRGSDGPADGGLAGARDEPDGDRQRDERLRDGEPARARGGGVVQVEGPEGQDAPGAARRGGELVRRHPARKHRRIGAARRERAGERCADVAPVGEDHPAVARVVATAPHPAWRRAPRDGVQG